MKIETRVVDPERKVVQITTTDERWYQFGDKFRPSVTWKASYYPKGIQFWKWLADKGWNEAEALKVSAGNKGSKVHNAVTDLIKGKTIKIDDLYQNDEGEKEELTADEWEAIISFTDWYKATNPEIIDSDYLIESEEFDYAGMVDLKCKIGDEVWIVDFKTGSEIWPDAELQVSAYAQADKVEKRAILQLGYKRNKNKYKFTEIEDKFDLFLSASAMWENENKDVQPKQREFPLSLQLEKEKDAVSK